MTKYDRRAAFFGGVLSVLTAVTPNTGVANIRFFWGFEKPLGFK